MLDYYILYAYKYISKELMNIYKAFQKNSIEER